ncbi:MAG: hypothetical protein ABIR62_15405 [Dokdonella sp.]|uniref:hypothetical protein n=1 Tax=Dokdonella sp. TaxID=2291710 RepID=UPI0032662031
MSSRANPSAPMRPLAVVETVSTLGDLQHVLSSERDLSAFAFQKCNESPQGYSWFNVCVESADPIEAMKTVRSVLFCLLDAADRGVVEHFRIVIGTDLLRRSTPPAREGSDFGGGPCVA